VLLVNETFGETTLRYHSVGKSDHDVLHRSTLPTLTKVVSVQSEGGDGAADGVFVPHLPHYSVYKANRNLS